MALYGQTKTNAKAIKIERVFDKKIYNGAFICTFFGYRFSVNDLVSSRIAMVA